MNFYYKNILLISDRKKLFEAIYKVITGKRYDGYINFDFACSPKTEISSEILPSIAVINVNEKACELIKKYDLIISLHCNQLFPPDLIANVKCINIHPGFNPYNRGWYPHIFSVINKLQAGVTIHEMDEKIDHGPIIVQEELALYSYDTSKTIYDRLLDLEIKLFSENIEKILSRDYKTFNSTHEGNVNLKKDFEKLRLIDLNKMYKGEELIDLLRALTHGDYQNAYFIDNNNRKVFIKISLEPEV